MKISVSLQQTGSIVRASQYESLMMDGFEADNVRGLIKIADAIAVKVACGVQPEVAIDDIFSERYNTSYGLSRDARLGKSNRTTMEIDTVGAMAQTSREAVKAAYQKCGGNAAAIGRELRREGIAHSRPTIAAILDELDLPRVRKPRG